MKLADKLLFIAIKERSLILMKMAFAMNCNPNSQERDGATPLHWAIARTNFKIVAHLLENGAKIDAKDKYGLQPLSMATGYLCIIKGKVIGQLLKRVDILKKEFSLAHIKNIRKHVKANYIEQYLNGEMTRENFTQKIFSQHSQEIRMIGKSNYGLYPKIKHQEEMEMIISVLTKLSEEKIQKKAENNNKEAS